MPDHGEQTQHGGRDTDTNPARESGTGTDAVVSAVLAALDDRLPGLVNASVTSQLRRKERDANQARTTQEAQEDTEDSAPRSKGGKSDLEAEVKRLRDIVQRQQKEREEAQERASEMERDGKLRRILEGMNVVDPDLVLRALKPDLSVVEGTYIHEAEDGDIPAERFVEGYLRDRKYLVKPAGRAGNGAVGSSAGRGSAPPIPPDLQGEALLAYLAENEDRT